MKDEVDVYVCNRSIQKVLTGFSLPPLTYSVACPLGLFGDLIHHQLMSLVCKIVKEPTRITCMSTPPSLGMWKNTTAHKSAHHSLPKQQRWDQVLHQVSML